MVLLHVDDIKVDHRFARLLPLTQGKEFESLVEDIKSRGVMVDLLVTREGLLLDGHRRLAAAKKAGLFKVPAKRLDVQERRSWKKAVAIAVNLHRRHLIEAQRANLGSSLLRIERVKATERRKDGQERGRKNRGQVVVDDRHPLPKEKDRATERAARSVGISRQTFERVEAVKQHDPELAQRMLDGKLSVTSAYNKVKVQQFKSRVEKEQSSSKGKGLVKDLRRVAGQYRAVYLDPPWHYEDSRSRGAAGRQYLTVPTKKLCRMPVGKLAHEDGCHFWMWTTWPMIREGAPHQVLESWGLRWVGEIVWDKESLGVGHYIRSRTEVLILAISGNLKLYSDCINQVVRSKRGRHSKKPQEFYELIEEVSPGPRLEMFARSKRKGWDRWGYEA